MSSEAIEQAIRENAPEWWGQREVEHIVSSLRDAFKPDREDMANDMWSMGAGPEHPGCPYGGPEPADADYENECDTCQGWLLSAADKILAADAEVGRAVADLLDEIETYGSTCWVPLCEWESPERFTREEAVYDYDEHAAWHRAANVEIRRQSDD